MRTATTRARSGPAGRAARSRVTAVRARRGGAARRALADSAAAAAGSPPGKDWREHRAAAASELEELRRLQNEELVRYRRQGAGARAGPGAEPAAAAPSMVEAPSFALATADGRLNAEGVASADGARACLVALLDGDDRLLYAGLSRNASVTLRGIVARRPHLLSPSAAYKVLHAGGTSARAVLEAARGAWIREARDAGRGAGIADRSAILAGNGAPAPGAGDADGMDADRGVWEKPLDVNCIMSAEELEGIRGAREEGNELKRARLTKAACRRVEASLRARLDEIGLHNESFRYDPKLKGKGVLDISSSSAKKKAA